jgi:uncharacterized phage-associated protein|nr:MAG TPA: hypothetical protein [Caudoviricetes sp.]
MIKKVVDYIFTRAGSLWYDLNNRGEIKVDKVTIFDIANFFLKIVERDAGSTITPLKLQKILYYTQGYYLAMFNEELFSDDFQAWAHGPANPDIYNQYKSYGFSAIDKPAGEVPLLDDGLISFLSRIWNTYGIFDGKYLEQLTHKETPWIEARGDCKDGEPCTNVISKESMKSFFKKRINE